ncbi:hypothetical protein [Saccharopolyspora cebuensis]|uniref:eRF1 domain-containing protein n=1 Tax=Saccharopolyspora cebuensis TaxID=418759 RepID=A0ABV4CJ04_9PSEU
MRLSTARQVFDREGPFATVYLEARSPGEDAGEQIRLRWRGLRERLAEAGAAAGAVEALEQRLQPGAAGEEQANGRVLVAVDGEVVLDEHWDAAQGSGDQAHWATLPELGAFIREAARSVRELVVISDQHGAQVRQEVVSERAEPAEHDVERVEGGAVEGVHKPRGGALSHRHIQRRAEEAAGQNAKDVARRVREVADRFGPRVVVLAGEVQGRTALRAELPDELGDRLVETGRGGASADGSEEALTEELLRIAGEESDRSAREQHDRWSGGLAHDRAVQGHEEVAKAAEMGAVETLLFEPDTPVAREAVLLKAAARTDAEVALTTASTGLADGVGAVLRFPVSTTTPS